MPSRANAPFMRLTRRVRSLTRHSRSRLGRLASSSASVGTRTMLQWPRSPRSHPRNPRFSSLVSSRSVLARRCSRDTATLEGWITCASPPRAASQRFWARLQLLAGLTLNAGNDTADQPARLAHLDDGNDRAILVQGDEGPVQVVRLGHL